MPGTPVVKTSPSNAGSVDLIPAWGAEIPHTLWPKKQNVKQKQYCNRFNQDFKNGLHKKKFFLKNVGHRGRIMYMEFGARLPGFGFLLCYFKLCDLGQVA